MQVSGTRRLLPVSGTSFCYVSPALGPVRPLMDDTLSKLSEHVTLCVEQIIVPYLGMILLN